MMIADIFTYNKSRYFVYIAILIVINTFLHPFTVGYILQNSDGTLNYTQAFSNSFVTWAISLNLFGLVLGGGIAAFKKRRNEPLQIRTATNTSFNRSAACPPQELQIEGSLPISHAILIK